MPIVNRKISPADKEAVILTFSTVPPRGKSCRRRAKPRPIGCWYTSEEESSGARKSAPILWDERASESTVLGV
jgi:hypothetical protein